MNKKEQLKKELKKLLELQQMAEDFEIEAFDLKFKGFHNTSKIKYDKCLKCYKIANEQKEVLIKLINEL